MRADLAASCRSASRWVACARKASAAACRSASNLAASIRFAFCSAVFSLAASSRSAWRCSASVGGAGTTGVGGAIQVIPSGGFDAVAAGSESCGGAVSPGGSARNGVPVGATAAVDGAGFGPPDAAGPCVAFCDGSAVTAGAGSSTTRSSGTSPRRSCQGKPKPGTPISSPPNVRLNSSAWNSRENTKPSDSRLRAGSMRWLSHGLSVGTGMASVDTCGVARQPYADCRGIWFSYECSRCRGLRDFASPLPRSHAPGFCRPQRLRHGGWRSLRVARSVASCSRLASRASISLRSGVPWQ